MVHFMPAHALIFLPQAYRAVSWRNISDQLSGQLSQHYPAASHSCEGLNAAPTAFAMPRESWCCLQREDCQQHVHEACAFEGLDPDSGLWACDQHMSQMGIRTGRRGSAGARKRRRGPLEATFLSPQSADSPIPSGSVDPPAEQGSRAQPIGPEEPHGARGRRGRASSRARGRSRKGVALAAEGEPHATLDGLAAEANGLASHTDAVAVGDGPMQPEDNVGVVHDPPKPASRGRRAARKGNRS